LSYRFYAIETLGYLAGLDATWFADLLVDANKGMASFRNEATGLFDGAYGSRLEKSLPHVVAALAADPGSRQATAAIWGPDTPAMLPTRDLPCTLALSFWNAADDGQPSRLDTQAVMRSNDLNWGWPYDVAAFATIGVAVASCLGWEVGAYHHLTNSLHVYQGAAPGPCPPNVEPLASEQWLEDIQRPTPRTTLSWSDLPLAAYSLALEVYSHRRAGRTWTNFRSSTSDPLLAYLGRLVAFSWRDWEHHHAT
jgi:hypothetical protein